MPSRITIDIETKSYCDLKKSGAWSYSEHETTDIICLCYGIDDQPIQAWWPGRDDIELVGQMPKDLYMVVMLGGLVEVFNVSFEFSMWKNVLEKKYEWIPVLDHQWRDVQATAC